MALTDEEYKALGEAEYMINDVLVEASPFSFGAYCKSIRLILPNMIVM